MHVLRVTNVNDAYSEGVKFILANGKPQKSRVGDVFSLQEPFALVYEKPLERVLFDPLRDANPFFHLFESLFLLAGRRDARWLDRFVGDFSSRFAEADGTLHGSYGFRWRNHFDLDGEGNPNMPDQLDTAVRLLKANPDDRRVVIQMWDPVSDLGQNFKDVPCNLTVTPRIRREVEVVGWSPSDGMGGASQEQVDYLDITVFNRSNDFIWGTTGANAVQFSMLLEYLAGRIGVKPGRYTQISTNSHLYLSTIPEKITGWDTQIYPTTTPMGTNWDKWDEDLKLFFEWTEGGTLPRYSNSWFWNTASTLYHAHELWKAGKTQEQKSAAFLFLTTTDLDVAPDWRAAAVSWVERRLKRMTEKQEFLR